MTNDKRNLSDLTLDEIIDKIGNAKSAWPKTPIPPTVYGGGFSVYEAINWLAYWLHKEEAIREASDKKLQQDITNETNARVEADAQLQTNIDAEAKARENADTQLQQNIDAEAAAREEADEELRNEIGGFQEALNKEIQDRIAGDQTLQGNIETTKQELQQYIQQESEARQDEDNNLQQSIESTKTELQQEIQEEAQARESADTEINTKLTDLEGKIPTGEYLPLSGGTMSGTIDMNQNNLIKPGSIIFGSPVSFKYNYNYFPQEIDFVTYNYMGKNYNAILFGEGIIGTNDNKFNLEIKDTSANCLFIVPYGKAYNEHVERVAAESDLQKQIDEIKAGGGGGGTSDPLAWKTDGTNAPTADMTMADHQLVEISGLQFESNVTQPSGSEVWLGQERSGTGTWVLKTEYQVEAPAIVPIATAKDNDLRLATIGAVKQAVAGAGGGGGVVYDNYTVPVYENSTMTPTAPMNLRYDYENQILYLAGLTMHDPTFGISGKQFTFTGDIEGNNGKTGTHTIVVTGTLGYGTSGVGTWGTIPVNGIIILNFSANTIQIQFDNFDPDFELNDQYSYNLVLNGFGKIS